MISIGGLDLNSDLIWQDRNSQAPISMSMKRTLAGAAVVYSGTLLAGEKITLEATSNYGWLNRTQVTALRALAAVQGTAYDLVFNGVTYRVIFDFTNGPAVDMNPLVAREADLASDDFTGLIHLLTI